MCASTLKERKPKEREISFLKQKRKTVKLIDLLDDGLKPLCSTKMLLVLQKASFSEVSRMFTRELTNSESLFLQKKTTGRTRLNIISRTHRNSKSFSSN